MKTSRCEACRADFSANEEVYRARKHTRRLCLECRVKTLRNSDRTWNLVYVGTLRAWAALYELPLQPVKECLSRLSNGICPVLTDD